MHYSCRLPVLCKANCFGATVTISLKWEMFSGLFENSPLESRIQNLVRFPCIPLTASFDLGVVMLLLRFSNTNISLHAAPRGRAELFISEISFE
jgi:hypothetical protein